MLLQTATQCAPRISNNSAKLANEGLATERMEETGPRPGTRNVYIVEDDEAVRASLFLLLSRTTGFMIRTFPSGEAFLAEMAELDPGVVLLDYKMRRVNGLAVLQSLKEAPERFAAVMLTAHGDVALSVSAMKSGAEDFLEKPCDPAALLGSVEKAFNRLDELCSEWTRRIAARKLIASLTSREQDVLNGLASGAPNKIIAYNLGLSARTVEIYRANLMEKLNARSLAEVLWLAFNARGDG